MNKSIYIAGKMRGLVKFNFPAFDAARDRLLARGWEVVSPADMDRAAGFDENNTPESAITPEMMREFYKRDVEALGRVDAIYLLNGWANSVGATAEYWIAKWLNLEIIEEINDNA
jgi:hypothetical protein